MFSMTGMFQGRAATVKYKDNILTGDPVVIEKAQYENNQDHGYLGLMPDASEYEYLASENSAYDLLQRHVFDSVISAKDDWEPRDPGTGY